MNSKYEDIPVSAPKEEGLLGKLGKGANYIGRNVLRTDRRILETLKGTPGDIAAGALGLGNLATKAIIGEEYLPKELPFLPTTETTRKNVSETLNTISPETEKYLKPQSKGEERFDEYVQDITSFLHPIGGTNKGNIIRKVAIPTIGNAAQLGAEKFGFSEPWQKGIKVGSMLLSSLWGKPTLKKQASDLYDTVEAEAPITSKIKLGAEPIEDAIEKVRKVLGRGDLTPSKQFAGERINSLRNAIGPDKKLSLDEAFQFVKDFNEFYSEGKVPQSAKPFMKELFSGLDKVIESGKSQAPKAVNNFQDARNIWRTINTSSDANEFVQNISDKVLKRITSPLTGYFFGIPQAAAGAAGTKAISGGSKILDRALRSKKVLNAYAKTAGSAAQENTAATARNLLKLDKTLNEEFPDYSFNADKYEAI